jgi:mutual gliding-motility protein MglA
MPLVQHARREVHLKVVYYGPGLGGKTTNLEQIHARTRPDHRGRLISLNNESERTLFFDLLPVELGKFKGYDVRLHLCTVPGQIAHDRTRRLVLRHVDGVVFVVDSQAARLDANIESMRNLETNLLMQGDDPDLLPVVVQYNKRDLPGAMSPTELRAALGIEPDVPEFEAKAVSGVGVFETLKAIVKSCLALIGDPATLHEGRSPSVLPGRRASMFPGGLPPGASREPGPTTPQDTPSPVVIPKAPRVPEMSVEASGALSTNDDDPRSE